MKTPVRIFFVLAGALCALALPAGAQVTNNVTTSGFSYVFSTVGGTDPTLTLTRGVTYVFQINAIGHPFYIKTNISDTTTGQYTDGVVGNGTTSGTLMFTVPPTAPNQLFYNCSLHSISFGMHGTLNIVNPTLPPPPSGQIVLISISPTLVTMQSLGAPSWTAIPEYSSNLAANAWAAVPVFTNTFADGTNTTTFDRLDAICGPNVYLRVRNQSN